MSNNLQGKEGQSNVQSSAPGQIPAQGYVPGQTPEQVYAPEQMPVQDYVPGQTPEQGYAPGQTPAQVYAPGQTPAQGYDPGQTPAQSYAPVQTPKQGYAPEQTPAQGYDPGQTPAQGYAPGQTCEQPASPSDDFTHIYQTGNFGTHFGKVNIIRAKRWATVHAILSLFMIIFNTAATVMMKNYLRTAIKNPLLGVSWVTSVFDALSAVAAVYFIWCLSTLRHPLITLMVMRILATFSMIMNMFFFMIGFLSAVLMTKDFVGLTDKEVSFLKAIYAIITILMLVKIFSSTSFVFHWWNCCPSCPAACSCFAPYCIFEEGEELAPGVPNSLGVQNIMVVGLAAAEASRRMNRL